MIACFDFTFALSRLSVPRMPGFRFVHVGHTLQLGKTDAKIYWLHYGDSDLGYRRIPFEWSVLPYALAPAGAIDHLMRNYIKYLFTKTLRDKAVYYVNKFESTKGGINIEKNFSYLQLTDNKQRKVAREYAEQYLLLVRSENEIDVRDESVNYKSS